MKNKKILVGLIVTILVILSIIIFYKTLAFESDKDDSGEPKLIYPNITDEYIASLYNVILKEDSFGRTSMYSENYTRMDNLAQDLALSMVYNYINNNNYFKLKILTMDEIKKNVIKSYDNISDFTPLYKISLEDFNKSAAVIFGKNAKIPQNNFYINLTTQGYFNKDTKEYYIYKKASEEVVKSIENKRIDSYVVTNNGNTIIIFDNYLLCDLETTLCYNDAKKTKLNQSLKFINGKVNLTENVDKLVKFKHIFKFEDGHYYWYSSELIS
ncbi:MAG: hypothetical protein RSC92_05370 [Clostridia bacterium]